MSSSERASVIHEGRYLRFLRRGTWEYVTRTRATGVVAIVALDDAGQVILVEQYRPAVDARVIELPAGLAGDVDDAESLLDAARRELAEETGYVAAHWTQLNTGLTSAGLTDESITVFRATGLERVSPGGGVDSERIEVHAVAVADLPTWLRDVESSGRLIDLKLLAGIYAAMCTDA